jgi:choice-of-anchor B domain-containing protein
MSRTREFAPQSLRLCIGLILVSILFVTSAPAQTSRNMQLLSHLNLYSQYIGCWSYIHSDGREYAAVGTRFGTSIVRLTDPANPVEVGFIPGPEHGIREVETYQTYLYVVARGGTTPAGIQVISMANPDSPVLVNTVTDLDVAENVSIDAARGYLYTTESEPYSIQPALDIYSLANPAAPARIAAYEASDIHDITLKGTRGYACSIPDGRVHILDLTNPAAPSEITSFVSANAYTHSAWPTEDERYLIVDDENLPFGGAPGGAPAVYNIQDLANITQVFRFDDLPASVVHFVFVRGNRAFFSYYTSGIRMWDITNPAQPAEAGFYDTWPGDDGLYSGCYEVSPFFPSGIVIAVDRSTGLYVLSPGSDYGMVRGIVRDSGGGMKPLSGVTVRVLPGGPSTTTKADGSYALAPNSGASVTVEASRFGYTSQTTSLAVTPGSDQAANFAILKTATGTIKGTVRRASTGAVIAGADVGLVGTPVALATTSMGKYTMSKVPVGTYTLRADYTGLVPAAATFALAPNPTITSDFSLQTPPFYDDAETDRGWSLSNPSDDAVAGRWIRAVPVGTTSGSQQAQPSEDHSPAPGTLCFVTGNAPPGAPVTQESVRGGKTTLTSPPLDLSAITDPRIAYHLWFFNTHQAAGPLACTLTTEISNDDGATWVNVSTFQAERAPWVRIEIHVLDYFASPSAGVRVRFIVENRIVGIVEAALDDFLYYSGTSTGTRVASGARAPSEGSLAEPFRTHLHRLNASSAAGGSFSWEIALSRPSTVLAQVFDVRGRLVRTIHSGAVPDGVSTIEWDARTSSGRPVSQGIYWLRVQAEHASEGSRFLVLR